MFSTIPVVSLGGNPIQIATELVDAYSIYGFAYVVDHGIPSELISDIFEANRAFHQLELADKLAISVDSNHRGYIALNTSTDKNSKLADVKKPNQSASFMMMREDGPDTRPTAESAYLSGANQWPDKALLPDFRTTCETYNRSLSALGNRLLSLFMDGLGIRSDQAQATLQNFEHATTWLRLLHYPPTDPTGPKDLYGSAPHCDFGCITILAQDEVGGLQVLSPGKDWIDVPPKADAFIVNVGDMLHRMSNGVLKATPHRVINHSGRERFSVPFFYDPYVDTWIKPWSDLTTSTSPARFEPLLFADFLRGELEAGYKAHSTNKNNEQNT